MGHPVFDVYLVCIIYLGVGMSSREVIRELLKNGWFEVAQVGSHKQFKHADRVGRVTVPHPKRDLPVGTLKSIEKQAGIKLS
jgi:predicted RNA binding protein YcfA (HicA-like mRNA interferase family)